MARGALLSLVLPVFAVVAGCSSPEEKPRAGPPVRALRVVQCGAWKDDQGELLGWASAQYADGRFLTFVGPLRDDGDFQERVALPDGNVPSFALGTLRASNLSLGMTITRHGVHTAATTRLQLEEARSGIFVEALEPREGSDPWRLVFYVPPERGRHVDVEGGRVDVSRDLVFERAIPSMPEQPLPRAREETAGEKGQKVAETILWGFVAIPIFALALVTAPIWVPIAVVVFSNGKGFSCGRPFRVRGQARTASVVPGDAWTARTEPDLGTLAQEDREELAREWLVEARAEHASVAAFSALSLDLIALGAPPSLVERAHRAALDEIVHARVCFALASAYAREPLSPGTFPEARAARRFGSLEDEMARLAVESLRDGCLIEGFAARVAVLAREEAKDQSVKAALSVIARDEARHVDLAWAILEWCLERGSCETAGAVERALASLPRSPSLSAVSDDERAALLAHGRFGRARFEETFRETREAVLCRARKLLAERAGLACFSRGSP